MAKFLLLSAFVLGAGFWCVRFLGLPWKVRRVWNHGALVFLRVTLLVCLVTASGVTAMYDCARKNAVKEKAAVDAIIADPKAWMRSLVKDGPLTRMGVDIIIDRKLKDLRSTLRYADDPTVILRYSAAIETLESERKAVMEMLGPGEPMPETGKEKEDGHGIPSLAE